MIPELYTYTNEQLIETINCLIGIFAGLGIYSIIEILMFIIKSIIYKKNKKDIDK